MPRTLRELAFSEVRDLIHRPVSVFKPDDVASMVLGVLKETDRYEAVVASEEKIGLVTVRDLLGVNQPAQTRVDGIWRVTGSMAPSEKVINVAESMIRNNVRAMPVVEKGDVIGLVSQMDVTDALCGVAELSGTPARELMRMPVLSLDVNERVALARRLMLERGFSHIPVVEYNRLVGMVTAERIVHTFIAPISKTTTGDRVGEKVPRFPGVVSGIMDMHPLTVGPDASALEVACGLRDQGKSACVVTDPKGAILGILTPRELMALLLRFRAEGELPVFILGLSDEDFFERTVAEEKVRRVVGRSLKIHPHIHEVSIKIERSQTRGNRTRYEATARALSPDEQFLAEADGWDLLAVFDEICDTLDKALRKSKHEPERSPRRRKFRR